MSNDKQLPIVGLVVPATGPVRPIPPPRLRAQRNDGGRLRGSDRRAERQEAERQRQVDEARTRESMREEPAPASMYDDGTVEIDAAAVKSLVETLARFVSRPMSVVTVDKLRRGQLSFVVQRCAACCAEIRSEVTHDYLTTLPHAIRFDYATHRCAPLERQLHDCTADELTQLHAELENEIERCSRRMVDVEKHLGLRKVDGTKDDGR